MFMPDPKIDAVKPGPVGLNSIAGIIKTFACFNLSWISNC